LTAAVFGIWELLCLLVLDSWLFLPQTRFFHKQTLARKEKHEKKLSINGILRGLKNCAKYLEGNFCPRVSN